MTTILEGREPSLPPSPTETNRNTPLVTLLWVVIAAMLPVNRVIPLMPRALWFLGILALICAPVVFGRAARPLYPAVWAFAGFASIVATLTATKSIAIGDNLFVGMQLFVLLGLGVFAITGCALRDPKFVNRLSIGFLVGQTASSAAAIAQVLGQPLLGVAAFQGRALGLAGHPNTLGLLCCVGILIALQVLVSPGRLRLLTFVALAANVAALFASGSLSSFVAVSAGLIVWILCMRRRLGKLTVGAIASVAVLWLVGSSTGLADYLPSVAERYRQVSGQTNADGSWEIRTRTYSFAWQQIQDDPIFGSGLGAAASGTYNGVTVTHNIFLRAWYQGGIFLAVAMGLVLAAVLFVTVKSIAERRYAGEVGIIVALIAFALTSAFFEQRDYWLPILVAWGSISASEIRRRTTSAIEKPTPPVRRHGQVRSSLQPRS